MTGRWLMLGLAVVLVPTAAAGQEALTRSPHGTLPAGLGCTSCHTVDGWQPVLQGFDHDTSTAFVLTGRHQDVACTMCHLQARFDEPKAGLTECGVCHLDIHRGALSPNCVECHGTDSFYGVDGIGVHQQTTFPLTGAHLQVTCAACHPGDERGVFVTREIACASCHQQAYETAEPVNHVAAGFPLECDACHTTVAWQHAVRFDHVTVSNGFPLEGRHAEIRCASCHDPATMQPIFPTRNPNDCYACHQDDYAREHGSAFPTTCVGCHTVWGWEGAEFDHAIPARRATRRRGLRRLPPDGRLVADQSADGAGRLLLLPRRGLPARARRQRLPDQLSRVPSAGLVGQCVLCPARCGRLPDL
jgi:hypothetical protein